MLSGAVWRGYISVVMKLTEEIETCSKVAERRDEREIYHETQADRPVNDV